jgi:predicted transcriptional regulator
MIKMSAATPKTKQPAEKMPRLPGRREFQILEILWLHHPLSVSQIRRLLPASPPLAYTTVMTNLEHLYRKGLVLRRKSGRAFFYEPAVGPAQTREALLQAFLADYFHSDPGQLRALLHPAQPAPAAEMPAAPPTRQKPSPAPEQSVAPPPPEDEDYLL